MGDGPHAAVVVFERRIVERSGEREGAAAEIHELGSKDSWPVGNVTGQRWEKDKAKAVAAAKQELCPEAVPSQGSVGRKKVSRLDLKLRRREAGRGCHSRRGNGRPRRWSARNFDG